MGWPSFRNTRRGLANDTLCGTVSSIQPIMQLILDTKGIQLTKKNQSFFIISEKGTRTISPAKLTSIAITANVMLGADAVKLAIKHQLPILFFDRIGKAAARLWSPYFESIATLRRRQVKFAETVEATAWMVDLFSLKTEGQLATLKWLRGKRKRSMVVVSQAMKNIKQQNRSFIPFRDQLLDECRNNIMGVEGTIARIYWQALGNSLPRPYHFQKRSRRPAADIYNAATNYLYGMLYSVVEGALFAVGLDPYLGLLHTDMHRKPTLAFDLIEPFRPWMDQLLLEHCLANKIQPAFFSKNQYGIFLNKKGKAYIIPLFNGYLRTARVYMGRETTAKQHIYYLAGQLARRIRIVGEG